VKPPNVVKPVHFEGLRKMGAPSEMAQEYYKQGADEIVYIDIVSSLYRREILFEQVEETTKEVFVPFAVGGGVTSIEDFSRLFHSGADKVIINSYALQNDAGIVDQAAKIFGSQAVVVNVEAKRVLSDWNCYSDCGRIPSDKNVSAWVAEVQSRGAGEILIQSVDCDGRQRGFDFELIASIVDQASIPVVAASGAGNLDDIINLATQAEPSAIALASVLHYQKLSIGEIKGALREKGIEVHL
jgi:cyclase